MAQWQRICLPSRRHELYPWVGKIPWRRKWQPTPVLFPRKSHKQRSLAGLQSIGSQRVGHDLVTKQQQCLQSTSAHNIWSPFSQHPCGLWNNISIPKMKMLKLRNIKPKSKHHMAYKLTRLSFSTLIVWLWIKFFLAYLKGRLYLCDSKF